MIHRLTLLKAYYSHIPPQPPLAPLTILPVSQSSIHIATYSISHQPTHRCSAARHYVDLPCQANLKAANITSPATLSPHNHHTLTTTPFHMQLPSQTRICLQLPSPLKPGTGTTNQNDRPVLFFSNLYALNFTFLTNYSPSSTPSHDPFSLALLLPTTHHHNPQKAS